MTVELRGLCMDYDGVDVLNGIDFKGDVRSLAVIGPSGGGKSTLLRIIGGLIAPTSGEVFLDGQRMGCSEKELCAYRRNLGFVFQLGGLFHHLSALQNIALPLVKVHGLSKEDAHARAMALLERFGLSEHALKRPRELSGGQQQRVAISRAIAPRPRLLLIDEPTSALDPEYTNEVLSMVHELTAEGLRFIIVTHEMGFARHACDKVAFLHAGRIAEYGDGKDVLERPKSAELSGFMSQMLSWNM